MDEDTYLDIVEHAHRQRTGQFCYVATAITNEWWRLSIVEREVDGHFPLSEDFFLGTENEAQRKAVELNSRRLDIGPRAAALLVASTMTGSLSRRGRGA